MLEKSPKDKAMNAACEAHDLIGQIAGPQTLGSRVKTALDQVARMTGIGPRRIRALWNNEARRIDADEIEVLRRVAARRRGATDENRMEAARLARLAEALSRVDAETYGADIIALRKASRVLGKGSWEVTNE